jgi:hypothetical protein
MTSAGTMGDGRTTSAALPGRRWRFWFWGVASLGAACVSSGNTRGSALYPQSGASPLPLAQVATLSGHVAEVDGTDVTSLMPPYELLPGCHIVRTPERWGAVGTDMSMAAQTGMLPFALPMRAAHSYVVEVRTQLQTGIAGRIEIRAVETNASGEQTGVFPVTSDRSELEACLNGSKPAT